jgi:hypothetical protein
MRIKAYVLVLSTALFSMSAGTKKANPSVGINPGDIAPRIESLEEGSDIRFSNHSGRYTLVNFWAVYDGESRMRNVLLCNEVNRLNPDKIAMCSISMDENESVFKASIKGDKLVESQQFRSKPKDREKLFEMFKLDKGMNNFLINDRGIIVASNIRPQDLFLFLN